MRRSMILGGLLACPLAHAALPPELDGAWYSPLQSGHGFSIERIDAEHALVLWHVFDPEGHPLTVYAEMAIEGNVMRGEALTPSGMRFGSFDPNDFLLPHWGELSIEFSSCMQATLRYESDVPGYGSGEIPVQRLLPLASDYCSLDEPTGAAHLAGKRIGGELDVVHSEEGGGSSLQAHEGVISSEGDLWLVSDSSTLVHAISRPSVPGQARWQAEVLSSGWLAPHRETDEYTDERDFSRIIERFPVQLGVTQDRAAGALFAEASDGAHGYLDTAWSGFRSGLRWGSLLPIDQLNSSTFGRPLEFTAYTGTPPEIGETWQIEVRENLDLCVRRVAATDPACVFSGMIEPTESDVFRFTLQDGLQDTFTGVGYYLLQPVVVPLAGDGIHFIRLMGRNAETGLTLEAKRDCSFNKCFP